MKKLLLLLLLALPVFAQAPQQQQPQQQRAPKQRQIKGSQADIDLITAEMNNQQKAWNAGDPAAYVNDVGESMEFTDLAGTVVTGRQQFQDRFKEMTRTYFKGARLQLTIRNIRFVRPKVVICDIDTEITKYKSLPPGAAARPGHPLRTRLKYVLTREGRGWVIAAGQETERKDKSQK